MPDPVNPLKLPLHVDLPDGETCELIDAEGRVIATDAGCAEDNLLSVQESRELFEQLAHFANKHALLLAELGRLKARVAELEALINRPNIDEFIAALKAEAAHQKERRGADHDEGKKPDDWLWTLAFLACKATSAHRHGDREKYLHHIVTAGALCSNWFDHAKRNEAAGG